MEHMEEGCQFISKLFGGKKVIFCHNPTAMAHDEDVLGYLTDLSQAGTQKLGRITAEVDSLTKHLRVAISYVGKKGRVIHIAHSQGALITALAAKQLTPLEMNQIEVLAFGGAAVLRKTPQTPFLRCINYYAVNDPLLFVVPQATQALRSGFYTGHDGEYCFLAPRMGDPILDHNLFNPTYAQALEWEGERFQRVYQSSLLRLCKRSLLLCAVLTETACEQLVDVLKKCILQPLLMWCILSYLWTRDVVEKLYAAVYAYVVVPLSLLLTLLLEWVRAILRGKDKYVPVSSILSND